MPVDQLTCFETLAGVFLSIGTQTGVPGWLGGEVGCRQTQVLTTPIVGATALLGCTQTTAISHIALHICLSLTLKHSTDIIPSQNTCMKGTVKVHIHTQTVWLNNSLNSHFCKITFSHYSIAYEGLGYDMKMHQMICAFWRETHLQVAWPGGTCGCPWGSGCCWRLESRGCRWTCLLSGWSPYPSRSSTASPRQQTNTLMIVGKGGWRCL